MRSVRDLDSEVVQEPPLAAWRLAPLMESVLATPVAPGPAVGHAVPVAEPLAAAMLPTKRPA